MTSSGPAVIVAVHDGYYGSGTGAGRSNRSFLTILCSLLALGARLVVMPVLLTPGSPEYDPAWHKESAALVGQAGGEVIPVDNGTAGQSRFGDLGNFRQASASAAAAITRVLNQADPAVAVAFDAPFYGLAPLLPPRHAARLVNVARATAALHAPADHERHAWERAGLLATARSGGHIAATSAHIRQHLTNAYGILPAAVISLTNGLTPAEQCPGPARDDAASLLPPQARQRFMLSYGRAEPYKGFDDLLDALSILKDAGTLVPHTVLGAVTEGPPLTGYQQHLAHRITAGELDATLLTTFTPGFQGLLAHPSLAAVIVPSRAEPFGRIPLEAYAAGASPVIATTAGGLAEIVTNDITGYTAPPASPRALASAISRAMAAGPAQKQRLLSAGRQLTRSRYDYQANVTAFLNAAAPWAVSPGQST